MNIKAALSAAWAWVRKLPIAKYIKPLWKAGLQVAVQQGGDELQAAAQKVLAGEKGAAAVKSFDRLYDSWQAKLRQAVVALPLPAGVENRITQAIQEQGDRLQVAARAALLEGSKEALDKAFDAFQVQLCQRIEAL